MTIANLCFHGIGRPLREREAGEAGYWVDLDLFRHTLDEAVGRDDIALSFDDGNRSDIEIALPELRERGLTAEFFPLAGRLEDPASLDGQDLRDLVAAGMTVGTHGWAHVPLRGLDHADARRELDDARRVLEAAAGVVISDIALPLGQYDRALLARLREAGYARVFTSDRYPARKRSWLQPRYSLGAADTRESVTSVMSRGPRLRHVRQVVASTAKRLR